LQHAFLLFFGGGGQNKQLIFCFLKKEILLKKLLQTRNKRVLVPNFQKKKKKKVFLQSNQLTKKKMGCWSDLTKFDVVKLAAPTIGGVRRKEKIFTNSLHNFWFLGCSNEIIFSNVVFSSLFETDNLYRSYYCICCF
jgi:hypothetical protein